MPSAFAMPRGKSARHRDDSGPVRPETRPRRWGRPRHPLSPSCGSWTSAARTHLCHRSPVPAASLQPSVRRRASGGPSRTDRRDLIDTHARFPQSLADRLKARKPAVSASVRTTSFNQTWRATGCAARYTAAELSRAGMRMHCETIQRLCANDYPGNKKMIDSRMEARAGVSCRETRTVRRTAMVGLLRGHRRTRGLTSCASSMPPPNASLSWESWSRSSRPEDALFPPLHRPAA